MRNTKGRSMYLGKAGMTYLVTIPRNRGLATVSLKAGDVRLSPGSTTPLKLEEGDVAELYRLIPGVRIRPSVPAVVEPAVRKAEAKVETAPAPAEDSTGDGATNAVDAPEPPKGGKGKGGGKGKPGKGPKASKAKKGGDS